MKASKKRGFTIIELVIVIAVVAILAAVLIPTFSNVIQKAKEANDTIMVKTMNTALVNDSNLNGGKKHTTMSDALTAAKSAGYDVTKIRNTANNNEILWDSVSDCFVYMKNGEITYIPDSKDSAADTSKKWNYYKIVDTAAEVAASDYSTYMASTTENGAIVAKAGFDAGENTAITSVKYQNDGCDKTVILYTNGGDIIIDASSDTVKHYGLANTIDIVAVANESYHEYGEVGFIQLVSGHLAVESTAKVVTIYAAAVTAKIDNNSGTIENAYAASGITNGGNVTLTTIPEGKTVEDIKQDAETKYNAVAVVNGDYQVSLEAAFTKALSVEEATIEIIKDIDMSTTSWKPIDIGTLGVTKTVCKNLTLNGNNHTISGLKVHVTSTNNPYGEVGAGQSNYYGEGLIGRIGTDAIVSITNITFDRAVVDDERMNITASAHTSQVAVVIGISSGTATLKNVNVTNSSVYGGEKVAALIGHNNGKTLIENCSIVNCIISGHQCYIAAAVALVDTGIEIRNVRLLNNVCSVIIREGVDSPIATKEVASGTFVTWDNKNWYAGSSEFIIGAGAKFITNYSKNGEYYSYN